GTGGAGNAGGAASGGRGTGGAVSGDGGARSGGAGSGDGAARSGGAGSGGGGGSGAAGARDAGGAPDAGAARAFPGAEGFGTETPGGRGGMVYIVTTLDWDGPGSLSEALLAKEPRIVVFRVSGVIDVPAGVSVLTEASSYVTVAGQTSPGGITLRGAGTT